MIKAINKKQDEERFFFWGGGCLEGASDIYQSPLSSSIAENPVSVLDIYELIWRCQSELYIATGDNPFDGIYMSTLY